MLKAVLQQSGLECDVQYFSLFFAHELGIDSYITFHSTVNAYLIFLGEWVFTRPGSVDDPEVQASEVAYLKWLHSHYPKKLVDSYLTRAQVTRRSVMTFLNKCLDRVDWNAYDIVGFSVGIEQLNASLALAKQVKERHPHITVLFGGRECFPPRGMELLRCFNFIDYVCQGEGEIFLPEFVKRLRSGRKLDNLPGLAFRRDGKVLANPTVPNPDLDSLPAPDYDDFMEQYRTAFGSDWRGMLHFEYSRGCTWGSKRQCTFCGMRLPTYRQKTARKMAAEIETLVQRYDPEVLQATDLHPPPDLDEMLEGLSHRQPPPRFSSDLRADVKKDTLEQLKQKGLHYVFIGIESLSTPVLRLMRKGTTSLTNIQIMKWCRELGVSISWNLLFGIPGEDPAEYEHMARLLPLLYHLTPPYAASLISLYRDSPYFDNPAAFGMVNIHPAEPYHYLQPDLSEESLWNLAYFFEFDYADGRKPEAYFTALRPALEEWYRAAPTSILAYVDDGEHLRVFDTRPTAQKEESTINGLKRQLYLVCDKAQSQRQIYQQLNASTSEKIEAVLNELVEEELMVREGQNHLSLAVDLGRHLPPEVRRNMPDEFLVAMAKGLYCTGLMDKNGSKI